MRGFSFYHFWGLSMVVSTEREKKKEKKKSESYPIIDKTEEYREKRCTLMVSLVMTEYNLLD